MIRRPGHDYDWGRRSWHYAGLRSASPAAATDSHPRDFVLGLGIRDFLRHRRDFP